MKLLNFLKKNTENVELSPQTDYNWRVESFKIIKIIQAKDEITRCKVVDVKEKGLIVKVEDLYAYLPFQFAPWHYPNSEFWTIIKNSLRNRIFDCKIMSAEQIEYEKFKIFVDATVHKFREIHLQKDVKLKGIILKVTENGCLIDVGGHFAWKYGSIVGFLDNSKKYFDEISEKYKEGKTVEIYFWDKSQRGTEFVNRKFYDICKKYVGSQTPVQVCKVGVYFKLFVEEKFDAFCADKITEQIVSQLNDDDIIVCEIVAYNVQEGFVVKHIQHDSTENINNWGSHVLEKYIGRANLQKDVKYKGIVVKKFANGVFIDIGGYFEWKYGSIIGKIDKNHFVSPQNFEKCEVGDNLSVIYNVSGIESALEFWEEDYFDAYNRYVGKIVPVSVYIIADTLTLLVEDKYKATANKHKGEKNIIYHHKNGDTIFCEILDYKPNRGYLAQFVLEEKKE